MKTKLMMLSFFCIAITSCKKTETAVPAPVPAPTAAKSFEGITFSPANAYFSTNGTMSVPVDSNQAKMLSNKIDITYFYNTDYDKIGFFDAKARSQVWYWNEYYNPWLSNSVETRFYTTTLTKSQFDAAKADQSKIAGYFSAAVLTPHAIFPAGSCIGGRSTSNPTSVNVGIDKVYLFKNTASGKMGLMYIRLYDQAAGWPEGMLSGAAQSTKVDIIREN